MKKILIIITIICAAISLNAQQKISQYTRTDSLKGSSAPYKPDSALMDVSVWNFAGSYSTKAISYYSFRTLLAASLAGIDTNYLKTTGTEIGYANYTFKNNTVFKDTINIGLLSDTSLIFQKNGLNIIGGTGSNNSGTAISLTKSNGYGSLQLSSKTKAITINEDPSQYAIQINGNTRFVADTVTIAYLNDTTQTYITSAITYWNSTNPITLNNDFYTTRDYLSDIQSNSKFGTDAGRDLSTGSQNTFIGSNAGKKTLGGSLNVLVGASAGEENTTGNSCTFVGIYAGQNTNANDNTFIGYGTGINNISGIRNTLLGHSTGFQMLGSYNVMLGYSAGYSETGSNKLYISNSNTTSPLIYGNFAATGAEPFRVGTNGRFFIKDTLFIGGTFTAPTDTITGTISFTDYVGNIGNSANPNDTVFAQVIVRDSLYFPQMRSVLIAGGTYTFTPPYASSGTITIDSAGVTKLIALVHWNSDASTAIDFIQYIAVSSSYIVYSTSNTAGDYLSFVDAGASWYIKNNRSYALNYTIR